MCPSLETHPDVCVRRPYDSHLETLYRYLKLVVGISQNSLRGLERTSSRDSRNTSEGPLKPPGGCGNQKEKSCENLLEGSLFEPFLRAVQKGPSPWRRTSDRGRKVGEAHPSPRATTVGRRNVAYHGDHCISSSRPPHVSALQRGRKNCSTEARNVSTFPKRPPTPVKSSTHPSHRWLNADFDI